MSQSFAGRQFYHGTTMENADGILHEGAKPRGGSYGAGVYGETVLFDHGSFHPNAVRGIKGDSWTDLT